MLYGIFEQLRILPLIIIIFTSTRAWDLSVYISELLSDKWLWQTQITSNVRNTSCDERWTGTSIRDRTFDTKEISKEEIKELAYRANLKVNFISNINIKNLDFKNAETIFSNFVQIYDFHIFAYDCLRRIYKRLEIQKKSLRLWKLL